MPSKNEKTDKLDKILSKHNLTERELQAILKSSAKEPSKEVKLGISGKHFKYGYFSDAHIGHKEFKPELWDKMVRMFKKEGVEFIVDSGDMIEGMSGRPGHVYELTHIGYEEQMNRAVELYSQLPVSTFGIDGNHPGWFYKKANGGAVAGKDLERRVKLYTTLGQNEGSVRPNKFVDIKLIHPNDGSAYAMSYKLQKLIESFSGGEKPSIVHSGHYHKSLYMFLRNVHGFESGTLCGQSEYMRLKKLQAHMGFGIVDVFYNKNGVDRLIHEFVPGYE